MEDAKTLMKLGWMISFTGSITFKNARRALEVIDLLPLDRMMIETDSPYMSPEPFRGRRNDSGRVHLVAEAIARRKGLDPEEVARITLENGKRFFRMAPLHHHLEMGGWSENKLFCVFSGLTLLLCVLAFWGVMYRYPM